MVTREIHKNPQAVRTCRIMRQRACSCLGERFTFVPSPGWRIMGWPRLFVPLMVTLPEQVGCTILSPRPLKFATLSRFDSRPVSATSVSPNPRQFWPQIHPGHCFFLLATPLSFVTPPAMGFCTECGSTLPLAAKFCGECGLRQLGPAPSPSSVPAHGSVGPRSRPRSSQGMRRRARP